MQTNRENPVTHELSEGIASNDLAMDAVAPAIALSVSTISSDAPLANFATPKDYGAVGDGIADDTVPIQTLFNSGEPVYLTAGIYSVSALTIPAGAHIEGNRTAILQHRNPSAGSSLVTIKGSNVTLRGFTIDGTYTNCSRANGVLYGHYGIYAQATSSAPFSNIRIDGLSVKNFGYAGIVLRCVDDSRVESCAVSRIGYCAIGLYSALRCYVEKNYVYDVFPGYTGTAPYLNAYGIAVSDFDADNRISNFVWVRGNRVDNIPSWEGIDEHNSWNVSLHDNYVTGCSVGIACEHHTSSKAARNISIKNNTVVGIANGQLTRDGQLYAARGGIVVNGHPAGGRGQNISIVGNIIDSCGDFNGTATGAALVVTNSRTVNIQSNQFYNSYRWAILLHQKATSANDGIFYAMVTGNVIDGVTPVGGYCYGIFANTHIHGFARHNMVKNRMAAASSGDVVQATPATYTFNIADTF